MIVIFILISITLQMPAIDVLVTNMPTTPIRSHNSANSSPNNSSISYQNDQDEDYHNLPIDSSSNIYIRIPNKILDNISRSRDIIITGSKISKANQLAEFDNIMPDVINNIKGYTIENFHVLSPHDIYLYGAINGVDLNNTLKLSQKNLINYIRIMILSDNPNHKSRNILNILLDNVDQPILRQAFAKKFPFGYELFLDDVQMKIALINNNINHISSDLITSIQQRYNTLRNHKYSKILAQLYNITNTTSNWVEIAKTTTPHVMESFILNLDNFPTQNILENFGIIVPKDQSNNMDEYIRNNIGKYGNIVTRKKLSLIPVDIIRFQHKYDIEKYVTSLTDVEILNNLGVYVPYNDRDELVNNIITCITKPTFMYPTVRSKDRSINTQTTLFTDITDTSVFMICYGTLDKYFSYELDELLNAFHVDETYSIQFRRPENPKVLWHIREIQKLLRLLKSFTVTPDLTKLINRINDGIIEATEKIEFDDIAITTLLSYDSRIKDCIKRFLYEIFYIGMYMRRWKGPGHDYPIKEAETKGIEPTETISHHIGIAIELLNAMPKYAKDFTLNLKICQYQTTGTIEHGKEKLNNEWDGIIKGNNCIRIASTRLIGTGYHYLRVLYKETIQGFDIKEVERIS